MDLAALHLPITTERLILRRFTPEDASDRWDYRGRADVSKYLYMSPWTQEEAERNTKEAATSPFNADGDQLVLAVERRDQPGVIGEVSFRLTNVAAEQAETGYILHPDAQGRGYASEAMRAMLHLGFATIGFHRIYARLDEENVGSVSMCQRLGMRQEARLIENDIRDGVLGTELIYAILRPEWADAR